MDFTYASFHLIFTRRISLRSHTARNHHDLHFAEEESEALGRAATARRRRNLVPTRSASREGLQMRSDSRKDSEVARSPLPRL